ncbi:hypothetical protein COCVIDRAFT_107668 [Bipolaris victoriae FI3]|uniref:Uncharacterized protein n=2 Tax=Bipolaris TaxID=33194 RepID=W6YIK9_COCC2|nr:uncharacterized protein COCCADRAFT_85928 [Bipolaris zeicola 26-R-13]XP_014553419.1 hypothetical protein COCVIDRAFT_107668 [Bipolaris victoriae FI3]EUC37375.1 hypothetical protein COCCADRAFT_85928 [Bipolaris zeicola 26-R-13]
MTSLLVPNNVYTMDKTGNVLFTLSCIVVLVSKNNQQDYRGISIKRTMLSTIECVSASGEHSHPITI